MKPALSRDGNMSTSPCHIWNPVYDTCCIIHTGWQFARLAPITGLHLCAVMLATYRHHFVTIYRQKANVRNDIPASLGQYGPIELATNTRLQLYALPVRPITSPLSILPWHVRGIYATGGCKMGVFSIYHDIFYFHNK